MNFSKQKSAQMKAFWGINEWARKSFSKNMEYAWKKVKEENAVEYRIKTMPTKLIEYVERKAGLNVGTLDVESKYNPYLETSSIDEVSNNYVKKYTNIDGLSNVMADTFQMAVFKMADVYQDLPRHKKSIKEQKFEQLLKVTILSNMENRGKAYKVQTTDEAQRDYVALACCAAESRDKTLIDIVRQALDDAFEMSLEFHENFILKSY